MSVKSLEKKRPYPIQQGLRHIYSIVPHRFRYSKAFWNAYNFLKESHWWSREKLEEYQMFQIRSDFLVPASHNIKGILGVV